MAQKRGSLVWHWGHLCSSHSLHLHFYHGPDLESFQMKRHLVEMLSMQELSYWTNENFPILYCSTAKLYSPFSNITVNYCIRFFQVASFLTWRDWSSDIKAAQLVPGIPVDWQRFPSLSGNPEGPGVAGDPSQRVWNLKLLAICSILCMFGISTCFRCGHSSKTVQKTRIDVLPSVQNLVS